MTLEELTPWLFARTGRGIRWGLETTRELLAGVGDPHRHFRSIHIGGTNGKGSVAALTDAALRAGGRRRRVGLYTSPHLVSFSERIRVDGTPVQDEAIVEAAERLRPAIERTGASFFEATTAIAFHCFAGADVEIAVVEVGLGGRLDSTNVLEPLVAAVTNVAFDHTEYLGNSLAEIAAEKAGIFKPAIPAITAESDPTALEVMRRQATKVGSPFNTLDELVRSLGEATDLEGTRVELESARWGRRVLRTPFPGLHQVRNALLAAETLGTLPDDLRPSWDELEAGFASARWPGRLQVVRRGSTTWVLDVAHNPAGVDVLVSALNQLDLPRPIVLVTSILRDKPWGEMLAPLAQLADSSILTIPASAPSNRRWDPEAAASWLRENHGLRARVIEALHDAISRAETLAPHGTVLVTGSVHTVGDAMTALGISSE